MYRRLVPLPGIGSEMTLIHTTSPARRAERPDDRALRNRWLMRAFLGVVMLTMTFGDLRAQGIDPDRQRLIGKIISIDSPIGMVKVPFGYLLQRPDERLLSVEGTVKFESLELGFHMPGATMQPYGTFDSRAREPEPPSFGVRLLQVERRVANSRPLSERIASSLRASNSRPGFPFTFENYKETIRTTNPHTPDSVYYFLAGLYDPGYPDGKNPHNHLPTSAWVDFDALLNCPRRQPPVRDWLPCLGRVDLPRMGVTFSLAMNAHGADHFDEVVRASIKLLRQIMNSDSR